MKNLLTVAAALTMVGGACSAMAQDSVADFTPNNIAVRIGIGLPLDNNLSNYGNTLFALGAEYNLTKPLIRGGDSYFSLDYLQNGFKFTDGVIPFCLNQRFYFKNGEVGRRTYGFIGVGGAIINTNHSGTVLAARGGVGADLGEAIFFEAAALVTDKSGGATGDSISFYIGYRF